MKKKFDIQNKVIIITGAAGLLAEQHIEVVLENEGIAILLDVDKKKIEIKKNYYLKKFKKIWTN